MKAYLKNYRQSPRKVRLIADLIKGKTVREARVLLQTTPKRATEQIEKLLNSAVSNAVHNEDIQEEDLIIADVRVDQGITLNRFRPRAHGRANRIRKRTSNVNLALAEKGKSKTTNTRQKTKKVAEKKEPAKKTSAKKESAAKKPATKKKTTKKEDR